MADRLPWTYQFDLGIAMVAPEQAIELITTQGRVQSCSESMHLMTEFLVMPPTLVSCRIVLRTLHDPPARKYLVVRASDCSTLICENIQYALAHSSVPVRSFICNARDMRRTLTLFSRHGSKSAPKLIQIQGGTFYREHPSAHGTDLTSTNPPLFSGLNFDLSATPLKEVGKSVRKNEHWAVISANGGTTFLEVLRGSYLCFPPSARTFPYLASHEIDQKDHRLRVPSRAIQYVGFNAGKGQSMGGGVRGAYLSARYESHREETDWSLLQYLKGDTELNPAEDRDRILVDEKLLQQIIPDLRLQKLLSMPVSNLSNGQTRRARIAKALLGKPELLLLDEPFMGLDPPTLVTLSPILQELATRSSPLLLLALRPQDPIPDWITHLMVLGENYTVALMDRKDRVLFALHRWANALQADRKRNVLALDKRMAELMTQAYGKPLLGVGDSLSKNGISRYVEHDKIMQLGDAVVDGWGKIQKDSLSPEDQESWQHATDVPFRSRSLQDWLVLTTTKPDLQALGFPTASAQANSEPDAQNASEAEIQDLDGEPLVELQSVVVKYGDKTVLGFPPPQAGYDRPGLNLLVRRGTRLALLGPNGSGKTTLLSLLTSDHPQSYSLPINFFGRSRLPSKGRPGLSLWEIQSRIGHSSPEIHAFFPKSLNIRKVLESAWSETYSSKPKLSHERDLLVDAFLRWWEPELRQIPAGSEVWGPLAATTYKGDIKAMIERSYPTFFSEKAYWSDRVTDGPGVKQEHGLDWAEDSDRHAFGVLPFGTQRLLLLLRAIIKQPDIIILDEAFSGLSAEVRDKAMCWLTNGETKFLMKESRQIAPVEVRNYRLDILRIAQKLGLVVHDIVKGRAATAPYVRLRKMSAEELLQISGEMQDSPTDSALDRWRFRGLTKDQALVVVSHVKEEIPAIVNEYVRLPGEEEVVDTGRGVESGRCDDGSIRTAKGWNQVWGFR